MWTETASFLLLLLLRLVLSRVAFVSAFPPSTKWYDRQLHIHQSKVERQKQLRPVLVGASSSSSSSSSSWCLRSSNNNYNNEDELEITRRQRRQIQQDLERQIQEKSLEKARSGGTGEVAAGAILGGLVLGPFGALFGASLGANLGSKNAVDRAKREEMERLGVTPEMLESAREVGEVLERSVEGLQACRQSLSTQQRLARALDADAQDLYEQAKRALTEGQEERAKDLLFKRTQVQDTLKKVLLQCAEEKKRTEKMESNVKAIEQRAMEIDALLRRTVGAKALQDTATLGTSLAPEDPLLQKFRDLGID